MIHQLIIPFVVAPSLTPLQKHNSSMPDLATLLGFDKDADAFVEETDDQSKDEEAQSSRQGSGSISSSAWYKFW
jgi:hypothetical protein